MNLFAYPFLADENIHPGVVAQMKSQGLDVWSVIEEGLTGQVDTAVLQSAHESGRVVLTHDSDFGALAIARQQPIIGIVYLRPGHNQPEFTLATLAALRQQEIHVAPLHHRGIAATKRSADSHSANVTCLWRRIRRTR